MFQRFTDRARQAAELAQEEARMLNHDWIGNVWDVPSLGSARAPG
jgi:hypothetical protein